MVAINVKNIIDARNEKLEELEIDWSYVMCTCFESAGKAWSFLGSNFKTSLSESAFQNTDKYLV